MDVTLVIMAAGIGSRFGGGVKQLMPVGPNGEIIMDYAIRDALEAGYTRVVFIIRKDLEKDFREGVGDRVARHCEVAYAFQDPDDLPEGFTRPSGRTKPWGTGQAVLSCRDLVHGPFLVINADDYYGKAAYAQVLDFHRAHQEDGEVLRFCLPGFILKNTLSEHGGVTRGICRVDKDLYLIGVEETRNVVKTLEGAAIAGEKGVLRPMDPNAYVSMNMWGLTPAFFPVLEEGFRSFLQGLPEDDLKSEYLLPTIIDGLVREKKARVKLLPTEDRWIGLTYLEDRQPALAFFRRLAQRESGRARPPETRA